MVNFETSLGTISIELDAEHAPETVANFLVYVSEGHYDGTIFHRVIDRFMIQGGGFDAAMKQRSTRAPIRNEANNGLANTHYSIAMARTSDPHSASAQFFINTADNDFLNHRTETPDGWGYCVFGRVVAGEDVVDTIGKVATTSRGFHQDVPAEAVTIVRATVV